MKMMHGTNVDKYGQKEKGCHVTTQKFIYQSLVFGEIKGTLDKPDYK
jgi:hypothetical protein